MNIRPDGTYVDVTFGGGGHSREILSRLEDGGRLLSFDQDEEMCIRDSPWVGRTEWHWVMSWVPFMVAR